MKNITLLRNSGAEQSCCYTWAVSHDPQITNGTTDTTFSPNKTCTRTQVVTFLYRVFAQQVRQQATGNRQQETKERRSPIAYCLSYYCLFFTKLKLTLRRIWCIMTKAT